MERIHEKDFFSVDIERRCWDYCSDYQSFGLERLSVVKTGRELLRGGKEEFFIVFISKILYSIVFIKNFYTIELNVLGRLYSKVTRIFLE